jgi:hypothetical protein
VTRIFFGFTAKDLVEVSVPAHVEEPDGVDRGSIRQSQHSPGNVFVKENVSVKERVQAKVALTPA